MSEEEKKPPAPGVPTAHAHRLFQWGLYTSLAYVGGLAIYAWFVRDAMLAMKPDAFATFLSGVFAPLAFLWLVLGFRQQGDELQNSANALWLQGEELRNSVEQQRQLVQVSREQLEAEAAGRLRADQDADRAAQPHLHLKTGISYLGPIRKVNFYLSSPGPTCSDVRVCLDGNEVTKAAVFTEGESLKFAKTYSPDQVQPTTIEVVYADRRGYRRAQKFNVPVDEAGGPDGLRTLGQPVKVPGIIIVE